MSKALFPGTFDPFTIGHEAIVKRTLTFMDEVVIAIVNNMEKNAMFPVEERVQQIRELYKDEPRVKVISFAGATPDIALEVGANAIVRGVRSVKDFEYEENLAFIYKKMCGNSSYYWAYLHCPFSHKPHLAWPCANSIWQNMPSVSYM